jgi:magnesium chelatase subunit I
MEFILHGLASYSLISKQIVEGRVEFKDLMGSIINLNAGRLDSEEDFDAEDFT